MAKKKKAEPVSPPAERTAEERLATHGYIGFTTHISSAGRALAISVNPAGARPEDRRLVDLLDGLCRVDNGAFRARAAGWPEERIADAVPHDLGVHLVKAGFSTDAAPEWPKIDLRRDGWRLHGKHADEWRLERELPPEVDGPF